MFRVFQKHTIIRSMLIISMIMLVCAFSGCDKSSENEAGSNAAQPEEKPALQIGEAGRTDTFEIAVTDVKKASDWIKTPAEGREYIIVAIKVTNISQEADSIGASDFQYVSSDSGDTEAYESYTGVETDPDTFGAADIAPGDTFEGSIVYSVPIDMTQIELDYKENYNPNPTLRFMFSK